MSRSVRTAALAGLIVGWPFDATLIVYGHQDPMGDTNAEDIHALIASSQLTSINKCGHFPRVEQPDVFRVAIQGFLSPQ